MCIRQGGLKLSLGIVLSTTIAFFQIARAGIFGHDDREETLAPTVSDELRELARSVPAIVERKSLLPRSDGDYTPVGYPLTKMNFCPEARFSEQQYVARCGASLIANDLVLTAGHCIDDDVVKWCNDYVIVFDYATGLGDQVVQQSNVFTCASVVYRQFALPFGEDLAIIRLARAVPGRRPVRLSQDSFSVGQPLTMIGYPLGITQKVVETGEVTPGGSLAVSFRHNLDTFSSNSGGPIFTTAGEQMGVLVRGTGANQRTLPGRTCQDWGEDGARDYAEGNTLLHLAPVLARLGMEQL